MSAKKKGAAAAAADSNELQDPVAKRVQESNEATLTYFMANLSPMLTRYTTLLQKALAQNPKAPFFAVPSKEGDSASAAAAAALGGILEAPVASGTAAAGGAEPVEKAAKAEPSSPLLRRQAVDPAEKAELEQSAIAMLRTQSNVHNVARATTAAAPKTEDESAAAAAAADGVSAVAEGSTSASPLIKNKSIFGSKKASAKEVKAPTSAQLQQLALPPLLLVQLKIIKAEARSLGKVLDAIHDWIALSIPTLKEDDNVGVSVMAAVIGEMSNAITQVREVYDVESSYVSDRAELDSKFLKALDADSAMEAIQVCDSDAWDSIEKGWRTLMRVVLLIHSTLAKNMKSLREPRSGPKTNLHM